MDSPDVEMLFERDVNGLITRFAYKVYNAGDDGRRALEAAELASVFLEAEGPEDHSTRIDVNLSSRK